MTCASAPVRVNISRTWVTGLGARADRVAELVAVSGARDEAEAAAEAASTVASRASAPRSERSTKPAVGRRYSCS